MRIGQYLPYAFYAFCRWLTQVPDFHVGTGNCKAQMVWLTVSHFSHVVEMAG